MKRILVTGNAGSGKSTAASRIAGMLGLPCHGLDRIVWQSGWRKTPVEERERRIGGLVRQEAWVIDGVSAQLQSVADVVVFLDLGRRDCFLRAWRRNRHYLFRSRPKLPPGCPEWRIIPTLCRIIWNFPAKVRPRILAQAGSSRRFFHVKNDAELESCLAELGATAAAGER
ncbi:AAA family ATPase [Luteolibacter marinus]|uniref:AAA family ATPase n=1 Tax=Luteolibacter marinus TaxID=2776705 RepID=UPI0018670461|nr:AAA family ATPase [Luteolibacter marinus]